MAMVDDTVRIPEKTLGTTCMLSNELSLGDLLRKDEELVGTTQGHNIELGLRILESCFQDLNRVYRRGSSYPARLWR